MLIIYKLKIIYEILEISKQLIINIYKLHKFLIIL